jgi:hypothetical protein
VGTLHGPGLTPGRASRNLNVLFIVQQRNVISQLPMAAILFKQIQQFYKSINNSVYLLVFIRFTER